MSGELPDLKISYFNTTGRAEMSRLALVIADISFEDERFGPADWPRRKPTVPYGISPTLVIDGEQYAQSNAILRYCGKLAGLYPSDPLLALQVDEIVELFADVGAALFRGNRDDPEDVRKSRELFVKEDVPRYFGGLEKRIEIFGGDLWAVGNDLTIADLAIYGGMGFMKNRKIDHVSEDVVDGFSRLNKIYDAVHSHPKVVAWNTANGRA
eukprot:GFKZ01011783.1.p2 GENE.GFKZ01011783.1~~GFKZ01011783.1.p2  ORF type:complete len:211 (+),score=32.93 GFKZ01011783.1:394-1026(+)